MTELGFPDSAESMYPPGHSEPRETAVGEDSHWGAFAQFLLFLGQRLLYSALVLLAIIFLTYFGLTMARGTSFGESLQEAVVNSVEYVGRLLQGDLGMATAASSDVRPRPMGEVIVERMSRSLGLLFISLTLATVLGVTLGLRAARSGSKRSLGIILTTIIGVSVPSFFLAFLLQWALTSYTRWSGQAILPAGGYGWDKHLVLPVLVLAARPLAQITRISFVTLRDVLSQDYVRTAHAKGLRKFQVRWSHVMRNAAIPILTTVGISFRFALSTLAVVELYFGWQGAGFTLLRSISQGDDNLTVTFILLLGLLIVLFNLLLELSYRLIDPRLWQPPSHVTEGAKRGVGDSLRSVGASVRDLFIDNRISRWYRRRRRPQEGDAIEAALGRGAGSDKDLDEPFIGKRSVWVAARRNRPFTIGGLMILLLALIVLFGPLMAPHNPYSTQGLITIDGVLTRPPLAPSETYPWGTDALGRDMQSLILAGAQQTVVLVIVVVAARFVLGVLLGAIAGWRSGSRVDRAILGLAEIIAAFPNLLLAMILILALGIRQGMPTFLIALGFIGWGEIMQYVRGKVSALRNEQFVESAVASGASTPRILNTHIMPNLFGALVSLIALEMGAVLMLLGELGFLSIFVGGGTMIELPGSPPVLFSDVPEWGALLSNIRYQARAYPWTGFYTMMAFFLAIFAFNLFGEGVRRAVESGHLIISRFVNRYTVTLVLASVLLFNWFQANSGATPFYRELAQAFDGELAREHVTALTDPQMDGRALGTPGQTTAAQYIAGKMDEYGLQAAGESATYFQERAHGFERLEAVPSFTIEDGGEPLKFGQDFAAYAGLNMTAGEANGRVRFVGLGRPIARSTGGYRISYPDLDRVDYEEDVLLAVSDHNAALLSGRTAEDGLLVVTDDPAKLERAHTLSGRSGRHLNLFTGELSGEETPALWISEETGNRLLEGTGLTVDDLRKQVQNLPPEALVEQELPVSVSMEVQGSIVERWPVQHVIGYRPGDFGYELCADCLDKEIVVVMAQYDSPPPGPEGAFLSAANDNASGVAVMLEAIRVIDEADYQPRRSFIFIAYSGEGLDGGERVHDPDVNRFLQAKTGFASRFEPVAIVQLRGLGDGSGERLEVSASGSLRLADVFETAAKQTGVRPLRSEEAIDISMIYEEGNSSTDSGGQQAPVVRLFWEGWEENARTAADVPQNISDENLQKAGRALAMALMALGREIDY
ncbi:MAG: ABC transporter permease subunit [Anaerolineaceae bacterium]|nr:MAG: ABC transporter permease subunit [Anaerolineaceae bacterium]